MQKIVLVIIMIPSGFAYPVPEGPVTSSDPVLELPEHLHDVANRLVKGSSVAHNSFYHHLDVVRAYHADKGRILQPSLRFRARVIGWAIRSAFAAAATSLLRDVRDYRLLENAPRDLREKQTPLGAVVACSDSRVDIITLLGAKLGEKFILKNVGGSIEHPDNPNELSDDAKEMITYANDLGIPRLMIFTHGKCGCIANAADPRHKEPLPDYASPEERVLHRMARRKAHLVKTVEDPDQAEYLGSLINAHFCNGDRKLLQMEIAHGLHSKEIAEQFIALLPIPAGRTERMEVVLIHQELRTLNIYMFNPETGRYVQLTDHKPITGMPDNNVLPPPPRRGLLRNRATKPVADIVSPK